MGVDLEDPSCELSKDKEEDRSVANRGIEHAESGLCNKDSSMLSGYNKDDVGRTKTAKQNSFDGAVMNMYSLRELEPHDRMEFESKEDALSFYKEYAKSIGFSAIIKASRRSRISGKFIDAKFVCSRYGKKNESARLETPDSLPGADGTMNISTKKKRGRINRSWSKTDCKACMHVKKRQEGRWTICNLIKEHNHEIFPDQACCFRDHRNADIGCSNIDRLDATHSRTKKMYMSSQTGLPMKVQNKKDGSMDTSGLHSALEEGDAQLMLEYFSHMQDENPNFFYAIDLNEEQRLRNVFWVDAKGRLDYANFSDVVFLDTTYVKSEYKLPFVPFIGVNHHFQFVLLGCAMIGDESKSTYVWLMQTWLRVMKQAPKVILTDQDEVLKETIAEVLKDSRHCFCLWHILSKIQEKLGYVITQHENFTTKFGKCILKSVSEEQFEKRWSKLVDGFDLRNDSWVQATYEDRFQWVPTYMKHIFLAGMSTMQRLESLTSLFDKYMQRKTTLKEFFDQYKSMLKEKYEDEAKADFETWHKKPGLKSPSPFGKQMAALYTHAIFKKFQVEVLGVVACHPKKESEDGPNTKFKVQDFEENQDFIVVWNDTIADASCSCQLFEYNGFLCRHIMIVLQMFGIHNIPNKYILKRWTKNAKNREVIRTTGLVKSPVERYNDICRRVLKLGDEASLSLETYNIAFNALKDALRKCESLNCSIQYIAESSSPSDHGLPEFEEVSAGGSTNKVTRGTNVSGNGEVN